MILERIIVMGLTQEPRHVLVNGNLTEFSVDKNTKTLNVHVNADLMAPLKITWI